MTIKAQLMEYMRGFRYAVDDRIDRPVEPPIGERTAIGQRGYEAGLIAYDVAERVERQRMERAEREEEWLRQSVESGNDSYVPEAGERIEDAIRMVKALADRSGKPARAKFNDRPVAAFPGDSAEAVWNRYMATADVGRNWS